MSGGVHVQLGPAGASVQVAFVPHGDEAQFKPTEFARKISLELGRFADFLLSVSTKSTSRDFLGQMSAYSA